MKPFLILLLFASTVTMSPAQPARKDLLLVLLVGQSNMAGRGKVAPEDQEPHPRVLMLNKERQWVPAVAPLHFDKPKSVGVGLGRSFGIELAEANPDATIGLIPCAVGGSPIDTWTDGAYYPVTKSHPWDDAIARATRAMRDGTLVAILWHQGESDSKEDLSDTYEKKLHTLITRFRKDLNAPDVPFIAGQMGEWDKKPWDKHKKRVDQAHRDLPRKTKNTAFVEARGLDHKGDGVHFDAKSYREFGKRYYKAYEELTKTR